MTRILYSYIKEKNHNFLIKEWLPRFPKSFQEKVLRYRRWQDAQLSLLGRLLLKQGLKDYGIVCNNELNMHYTSYNKPYFIDLEVEFNISHSGDIVVCAITQNNDIGIDIEIVKNIEVEDFKNQMTSLEWQRIISSGDIKNSFFNYWTQKEAVIKAHGMGLSVPLKSFEIINNHTIIDTENFYVKEVVLDQEYKCHLAFKNTSNPVISNPIRVNVLDMKYTY
ncbi:4'-phosphopantetheinyl transferase superfamily protein [Aquimarina gracilis]|uniref:4'-phosphopantetheinyl transferase superfamily protein n=1 Tax=Aquimarina gracilis TaxID=874422 RepID=A0ABU5ZSF1_9FLAO|nr:4'-phosphopantetheinyl transferase superfamily protein [Aquimarina gracilis]MEB3344953.1 4'-phosphopantetheinyl transferase superfamily protein [Aquimarina gracilis]